MTEELKQKLVVDVAEVAKLQTEFAKYDSKMPIAYYDLIKKHYDMMIKNAVIQL